MNEPKQSNDTIRQVEPVDLEKLAEDLAAWVVKPAELKEIQKTLRTATSGMAAQLTAANAEIERLTERNKELEAALKEADFYLINVIGAAEPSYWIHKAEDALAKALTPSTETKEGE